MRLRFSYTELGVKKYFEIRPRETGVSIPVSSIGNHYSIRTYGDKEYIAPDTFYINSYDWSTNFSADIRAIGTRSNALTGNPFILRENNMLYDHNVNINDATKDDGQKMYFDSGAGSLKITAFIRTEYPVGVPTPRYYMGALFEVTPTGDSPKFCRAGNMSATYSTDDDKIPMIDFALFTATDSGNSYSCLQVTIITETFNYIYIFDMRMFDGTAPAPTTDTSTTTPYGRTGTYNFTSDKMTDVQPTGYTFVNRWDHGLTLYHLNDLQVSAIFSEFWGNETLWQMFMNATVKQIQGVIALHKVPVPVSSGSSTRPLTVFGKRIARGQLLDQLPLVNDQMIKYPSSPAWIPVEEIFGDFFDYAGQTRLSVYLPFVGTVPIDVNRIQGGAIMTVYYIDLLTGNLIARVFGRNGMGNGAEVLLFQGSGNCALSVPFVGNDQGGMKMLGALAGVATAGLAAVALGGAAAAPAMAAVTGTASAILAQHEASVNNIPTEAAPLSYPYVCYIQEIPERLLTAEQVRQLGYAAASGGSGTTVSDYSGYVQGYLHADIPGATAAEKQEIENAFRQGVIL